MPAYDFTCTRCRKTDELICRSEERDTPRSCSCGGALRREFPITALRSYREFTPYYDECLGADITSAREKKRVMQALGVTEAGDTVGGARNFDKHAPEHIKPRPVQGVPFISPEERDRLSGSDWKIEVEKKGKTSLLDIDAAPTL